MAVIIILIVISSLVQQSAASISQPMQASLTEWTIPTPQSGPLAVTLSPSGACCWFLEYYGNKIGHLDPTNGTFQEWTIPIHSANPYGLTVTSISGSLVLWGTEFGSDTVFAFWPDSGTFREYALPHYGTGVAYISAEPTAAQARVWFTETTRNANGEFIYDPTTGNVTLYEDTFPPAVGGGAFDVHAGSGAVWFAGFSALVRWDRASQQYTMWPLPVHGSAVGRFLTIDSYGQAWYTQGETNRTGIDNFVGVLRENNLIQEWRLADSGADPRGVSVNPATQQPWIVERSPNAGNGAIATLSAPSNGTIVSVLPSTAPSTTIPFIISPISIQVNGSVQTVSPVITQLSSNSNGQFTEYTLGAAQPNDIVVDPAGNAWLSEPGTNKLARLSMTSPDFALTVSPAVISVIEGQSGTVDVTGSSISGYSGQATLAATRLPAGVTVSFDKNLVMHAGANDSSEMLVNVAANAPPGIESIIIQASGILTRTTSVILTVVNSTATVTQKPQCLIATATYGSEISPEVEFLRDFRDNALKSRMGSSFLIMFNTWYYSFSPYVANYINDHPFVRTAMKLILYPLLGILILASKLEAPLDAYPEVATLISGLIASLLIGGFYIGLPLGLIARKFRFPRSIEPLTIMLLGGFAMLVAGEALILPVLLMLSTSIVVLSVVFLAAALVSRMLSK